MPYYIKKIGDKYKVCLRDNPKVCFSKKGIPLENAIKQERVLTGTGGVLGLSNYAKSPNFKSESFQKQLLSLGIPPEDYLQTVKHLASKYRYDPEKVSFCLDGKHKLVYDSGDETRGVSSSSKGPVKFGAVGYGDFLIWKFLEKGGKVEKGLADKKRDTFVKSHSAMGEKYDLGSLSPNTLAIRILWDSN
tara:strand:+ start:1123 stop:1692 length:570 start_codon:yes stop_codon:yes gene_type:complete